MKSLNITDIGNIGIFSQEALHTIQTGTTTLHGNDGLALHIPGYDPNFSAFIPCQRQETPSSYGNKIGFLLGFGIEDQRVKAFVDEMTSRGSIIREYSNSKFFRQISNDHEQQFLRQACSEPIQKLVWSVFTATRHDEQREFKAIDLDVSGMSRTIQVPNPFRTKTGKEHKVERISASGDHIQVEIKSRGGGKKAKTHELFLGDDLWKGPLGHFFERSGFQLVEHMARNYLDETNFLNIGFSYFLARNPFDPDFFTRKGSASFKINRISTRRIRNSSPNIILTISRSGKEEIISLSYKSNSISSRKIERILDLFFSDQDRETIKHQLNLSMGQVRVPIE